MKVPDKIYIEQKAVMYDLVNIEPCKPDDYEYVSKDALIEWLKENLQETCDEEGVPFEYYENGIITGKISAFEQVINKLNSM